MATEAPPPSYGSDVEPSSPNYSVAPRSTERTLERSSFVGDSMSRTGTGMCLKTTGGATLLLHNQLDGVERPLAGPGKVIHGEILLERPETVRSVVLKIDGLLEYIPLTGVYSSIPIVAISEQLYSHTDSPASCSSRLSFSTRFPSVYRYEGRTCPLPPACHIPFGNTVYFLRSAYHITAKVVSVRHKSAPFLTKEDRILFELEYHPNIRPPQPILDNPSLFKTVKECPEEWTQIPLTIGAPAGSNIVCDFFAPAVGMFCLTDEIPFHIQLCGPLPHVQQFLEKYRTGPDGSTGCPFRVQIVRRITMDAEHRKATRQLTLGEATLHSVPPDIYGHSSSPDLTRVASLHWEGRARCRDLSICGSINAGAVVISDWLAVEIAPLPGSPSQSPACEYAIVLTRSRWDSGASQ
ncbi:hypothetical protein C8J57DRAFT_1333232 [Mycena rebaudengoi]|nr:hypothetical protein C8J57DRAFT_1333232 [Mycena rebaudengoi]